MEEEEVYPRQSPGRTGCDAQSPDWRTQHDFTRAGRASMHGKNI